jgi:hypothetical protein
MSRLQSFLGDASDTRLMELFQILSDEKTGDIEDVYKDMLLARKIMLSKYNKFNINGIVVRAVYYYNNRNERHDNNHVENKELNILIKQTIEELTKLNILMPFIRTINTPVSLFHEVFWCICQNRVYIM